MRREHTIAWYRERIAMLREAIPDCALSTDIIVGYPGETEEDFQATWDLMAQVRYNSAYVFIYSPRPHTPAASIVEEQIPHAIAVERLERLNELQRDIGTSYLLDKVGTIQGVLVQGAARRGGGRLSGWTEQRETVVIDGDASLIGEILAVRITGLSGITLHGEVEERVPQRAARFDLPVLAG
jgi:tRNA-2-methylthio-N6-dimethylallyladenosine synthase